MYENDKRIVLTLDAGGTNLFFCHQGQYSDCFASLYAFLLGQSG